MYFQPSALRTGAGAHYQPGFGIALSHFSLSEEDGLAELMSEVGQSIRIRHLGNGRLHFHTHGWSGNVRLYTSGSVRNIDLYSETVGELWVDFESADGAISELVIAVDDTKGSKSQGFQVWLRGIEFESIQPWQQKGFPISSHADVRFAEVGSLLIPHHDEVIGKSIMNTGVWAKQDLEFFNSNVAPGDTVLDIGANIGHHTVFFSKAVGPHGKVFAFEPQTTIFRYNSANLAINSCNNTVLFQGCLGAETDEVRMQPIEYDQFTNFGALGVNLDLEADYGERVPVWTLDSLIEDERIQVDRIDFVKIDVQSFELYVLQGAVDTLTFYKPKLFLEISPYWMSQRGYKYEEVYEFLFQIGYEFNHFSDGSGITNGIRQWSGRKSEEWDVFCVAKP